MVPFTTLRKVVQTFESVVEILGKTIQIKGTSTERYNVLFCGVV